MVLMFLVDFGFGIRFVGGWICFRVLGIFDDVLLGVIFECKFCLWKFVLEDRCCS